MGVLFVFAWILFSELFVLGTLPPSGQIGWAGATQPHAGHALFPCPPVAPPGCHVKTSFPGRPWNLMASTEWEPLALMVSSPGGSRPLAFTLQLLRTWLEGLEKR